MSSELESWQDKEIEIIKIKGMLEGFKSTLIRCESNLRNGIWGGNRPIGSWVATDNELLSIPVSAEYLPSLEDIIEKAEKQIWRMKEYVTEYKKLASQLKHLEATKEKK